MRTSIQCIFEETNRFDSRIEKLTHHSVEPIIWVVVLMKSKITQTKNTKSNLSMNTVGRDRYNARNATKKKIKQHSIRTMVAIFSRVVIMILQILYANHAFYSSIESPKWWAFHFLLFRVVLQYQTECEYRIYKIKQNNKITWNAEGESEKKYTKVRWRIWKAHNGEHEKNVKQK